MASKQFTKVSELNKQYNEVRDDILVRHGFEKGANVRLKNAIALYENIGGTWIKRTSIKADMIDHLKMYAAIGKEAQFTLKAMV